MTLNYKYSFCIEIKYGELSPVSVQVSGKTPSVFIFNWIKL